MLARESRLNKKSDIVDTIRNGRRIRTPYVLVYVFKPVPLPAEPRVAVVVGKKVDKSSVKRHKYQRWLRETAKVYLPGISPCDMVWVALPSIKQISGLEELKKSLEPAVKKLHNLS